MSNDILIDIKNLSMYFPITKGIIHQQKIAEVKAVDDVHFFILKG